MKILSEIDTRNKELKIRRELKKVGAYCPKHEQKVNKLIAEAEKIVSQSETECLMKSKRGIECEPRQFSDVMNDLALSKGLRTKVELRIF